MPKISPTNERVSFWRSSSALSDFQSLFTQLKYTLILPAYPASQARPYFTYKSRGTLTIYAFFLFWSILNTIIESVRYPASCPSSSSDVPRIRIFERPFASCLRGFCCTSPNKSPLNTDLLAINARYANQPIASTIIKTSAISTRLIILRRRDIGFLDFLPRFFRPSGVVGASRSDRLPISCNDASISARSEFLIVDGRCAARDIAGEDNGFGNSA